ncbi:hypothetical protein NKG94_20495 [Micromonospora sp. M12]
MDAAHGPPQRRRGHRAVPALALNLTVLYVVSIAGVALDLLAWQCLGTARCRAPSTRWAGSTVGTSASGWRCWHYCRSPRWHFSGWPAPAGPVRPATRCGP